MKRILLALGMLCLALTNRAQEQERPTYTDNEIYLGLTHEAAARMVAEGGAVNREAFLREFASCIREEQLGYLEAPFYAARGYDLQWVLRFSVENVQGIDELTRLLNEHPSAIYAERVPILYLSYSPNDLGSNSNNNQWHLYKIQAREAWDISKGSREVKVAIVDDAVLITHPDLSANIWTNPGEIPGNGKDDDNNGYIDDVHGWDAGGNDNDPLPNSSAFTHGTHCAGIAGATTDNNTGVASIGFNISIMPVKCTLPGQSSTTSIPRGYEGITYAAAAGADVISCSWGSAGGGSTGFQVIQYAQSKGAIVVAAMGNDYTERQQFPANYGGVISVAATSNTDSKANYSNYHSTTVISAPGNYILSTVTNNTYSSQSGTSMATPLVSGLLGLMKSHKLGITTTELRGCLLNNADNIDAQNGLYIGKLGAGRINAYKSLQCVDSLKWVAPDIRFSLDGNEYCPGSLVEFSAISTEGDIDSFYWEFPGGTPAFSTDPKPVVSFPGIGTYSYSLTAFNAYGQDKDSVTNGIVFSDQGKAIAVSSGFETGLGGSIWTVENSNPSYGWNDATVLIGGDTFHSAYVKAYGASSNNIVSSLVSPVLDFSDYGNARLSFNYAYARRSSASLDSLFIDVSSDSGQHFETVYSGGLSAQMSVSGSTSSAFVPNSPGDWCEANGSCLDIDLKKYNRQKGVVIRIRHKGRTNANNFYLDKVLVTANCAKFNTLPAVVSMVNGKENSCGPVTVEFRDNSPNYPSGFHWYFPGGAPTESDNPDADVYYDQIGDYDVILVVENEYGKDSVVFTNKVSVHGLPTVSILLGDTLFCAGGSTTMSGQGASSYKWSPIVAISSVTGQTITASPTSTTTYYLEGTDAFGCKNYDTATIQVLQAPLASLIFRSGNKLYIAAQSGVDYQWYRNGVAIPGADSYEYYATESGSYTIVLTNSQTGCSTPGREPVEYIVAGLQSPDETFRLYPVPAHSSLVLESDQVIGNWEVYAADGKLIASGMGNGNRMTWDTQAWADGIYLLQWNAEGKLYRQRFSVQH